MTRRVTNRNMNLLKKQECIKEDLNVKMIDVHNLENIKINLQIVIVKIKVNKMENHKALIWYLMLNYNKIK